MKLLLHTATNGQYYFTLNGKNGQVIMTSETYTRKASAKKMMGKLSQALKMKP